MALTVDLKQPRSVHAAAADGFLDDFDDDDGGGLGDGVDGFKGTEAVEALDRAGCTLRFMMMTMVMVRE
jgi:hypothetical protein